MQLGRDGNVVFRALEQPYARSALFQWLFKHQDEVIAAAAGRRIEGILLRVE